MRRFVLTAIVCLSVSTVFAWSEAGHKVTGSIAYRQLTPDEQAKVIEILKHHPRFKEDFESKIPAELTTDDEMNEWMFQQMAVWPDVARSFQGEDRKYNHPTWHYLDIPIFLTPDDKSMEVKFNVATDTPQKPDEELNAVQVIKLSRKMLVDSTTPDEDKAVMLCWLFHLTGDIHQPLHSASLCSKMLFPEGDKGGNLIRTDQRANLHGVWDQFLGRNASFTDARNRALKIGNNEILKAIGANAAEQLDETTWLNESHMLAQWMAYDEEVTGYLRGYLDKSEAPPIHLTERYLKAGGDTAEKRVTQAGYRLGSVLKELVREQQSASQ